MGSLLSKMLVGKGETDIRPLPRTLFFFYCVPTGKDMWSLIVFIDNFLSFELLFLLKVSWVNHISFELSLSQHPIKHSFAYQGMNNSNKKGALTCGILWIHLPSLSLQEEKHIMSLSRCQVSPHCSLTAKHQAIPIMAWPGCYTLEMNLRKSLMHWVWGSTSENGDVRRWC